MVAPSVAPSRIPALKITVARWPRTGDQRQVTQNR